MLVMKIVAIAQTVLYLQPDAKIANGVYWTKFWIALAMNVLS